MKHRIRTPWAILALAAWLVFSALSWLGLTPALPAQSKTLQKVAFPPIGPQPVLSPYAQHVLSLGPVGYWRLGEPKGQTAVDWSKHNHQGAYQGTPTHGQLGAIKNDPDDAIRLDGRSYVQIKASGDFSLHLQQGLTVEAWMRPDVLDFPGETHDPYVHWLGKGEKANFEWGFRFYSRKRPDGTLSARPNRISAYLWNAAGGEGAGAYFQETLTPGQWIHVVAVYEPPGKGAGVRIYRNGGFKKGPPDKGTLYSSFNIVPTAGTAPLRLGTRDLASFLRGGLDEVAIYPRMLTAEEIRANYLIATRGIPGKGL